MRNGVWTMCLAAAILGASATLAEPVPDGGMTAAEVAKVLHDKGYRAEITTDSVGDPLIESGVDGTHFSVYFYGCEGEVPRCNSIQLMAAFDLEEGLSLERINLWNREHRFGRGYLDDESDPFVEMDLDVEFGFSTEALANNLDTWSSVLPGFKEFIGF